MAHPLTQHPPSSLPFAAASRPSPVAFGFGHPSPISAFPLITQGSTSRFPTQSLAFGAIPGQPASSPKRQRPSPIGYKSAPSLKRTRKSSSSSDSAPPSPRNSSSPLQAYDLSRKDELRVESLGIKDDGDRIMAGRKVPKRLRSEISSSSKGDTAQDQDVGVLLATLPQTSHLPILMNILRKHPSLVPDVLSDLPQPDLDECLAQLDRIISRVRRKTGSSIVLDQTRAWTRIQDDVLTYCRTASTYISFFTTPPSSAPPPDPATLQALLFATTTQVYSLLQLVPPAVQSTPTQVLLELGKSLVATWTTWVTAISQEVNQRGGMYPRSLVEGWATNLDDLANHQHTPLSFDTVPASHPLVDSFRSAFIPILEKFITDLGWLIDRRPAFSSIPAPQPVQAPSWGAFRPVSAGTGDQYNQV